MIMQRFDTTKLPFNKARRLDLGSLRAGGATWLLSVTEDSEDAELVRRRGRWLSHRTMEIYIQEFSSIQFIHRFAEATQAKLYSWFKLSRILLCELRVWFCLGRRQGLGFLNSLWESALEAMGGTCWRKRIFSCMPQRDSSIRCAKKMEGRESLSTCAIGTRRSCRAPAQALPARHAQFPTEDRFVHAAMGQSHTLCKENGGT